MKSTKIPNLLTNQHSSVVKIRLLLIILPILIVSMFLFWKINSPGLRSNYLPSENCIDGEDCQVEINSQQTLEQVYQGIINEPIDQIDAERTAIEEDFGITNK